MCIPSFNGAMKPAAVRRPLYYSSYRWLCTYRNASRKNYYDILGVKPDASIAEIKSAFYKLSKKYHPDATRNSSDAHTQTEMYLEIRDAYDVLKDEKKRRDYDLGLTGVSYGTHYRTYGEYGTATNQRHHQTYSDPGNFYARTPQYDNDKWYKWYQKRRREQMEARWSSKSGDEEVIKTLLIFFAAFFVFTTIARIRSEHLRRKQWIEDMRNYSGARKAEHMGKELERYREMIRKAQEEKDKAAAKRKVSETAEK